MRAAVLRSPGDFAVETVPDPRPDNDEVVVQPTGCGVCGTDLHLIDGDLPAARYPVVPGHEFGGVVVASETPGWAVGDRVAVAPKVCCGQCHFCRLGRTNLCENGRSIGVIGIDGGFAEFVGVPVGNLHRLPDGFPAAATPLVEPLGCAIHGFDLLEPRLADHLLIYGAGTIGLLLAQLAARRGVASLSVVDRNPARLEAAAALGAAVATDAAQLDRPEGWEIVIDATGAVPAIEDGLRHVRKGGTMLLFGVARPDDVARLNPFRVFEDELRIIGARAILHSFDRALALLAGGVIVAEPLVTHRYGLDEFAEAIATFREGNCLKVEVRPG